MSAAPSADSNPSFQIRGSVVRSYLKHLDEAGVLATVREGVGPRTRALVDRPPFVLSWVHSEVFEDLYRVVHAISGSEGLRRMTHEATRNQVGPLLGPLIQGAMKVMGSSPSSVFAELNTIAGPAVSGIRFTWTPSTECSGELLVQHSGPSSELVYEAWTGTLRYAFDVCGVDGEIESPERMPDGCSARLRVRWKERAL